MSKIELRPFEEQLANVIYANRLEKAKKEGMKEGIKEGEANILKKLLKKNTAEEISKQYDIPLEKIEKIEKTN